MTRSHVRIASLAAALSIFLWTPLSIQAPNPIRHYAVPKTVGAATSSENRRDSSDSAASDTFVLKTQVLQKTDATAPFGDLYVFAYHAGAGINDAMLGTSAEGAAVASAFADNSTLPSDYFAVLFQIGEYPYELTPTTGPTSYTDLLPVQINVNGAPPTADNAFYFENQTTLQWTSSADSTPPGGFAGWLACNSTSHPSGIQLFYRVEAGTAPEGCADVDLVVV